MCVPIQHKCEPCYDMLDPDHAVENGDDKAACSNAPAYCRVFRGQVNPYSCDARDLAPLIDQGLIRIPTPYRCRLELPFERVDLQPDGYRVVLSQGFVCPNGSNCRPCPPGQTCNVGALRRDQLRYLIWDRFSGLLGGDLGLHDITGPGCYPGRNELGGRPVTGTSALLGQLKNGTTVVNPAGCGWQ
jgi:hypothetical protein